MNLNQELKEIIETAETNTPLDPEERYVLKQVLKKLENVDDMIETIDEGLNMLASDKPAKDARAYATINSAIADFTLRWGRVITRSGD